MRKTIGFVSLGLLFFAGAAVAEEHDGEALYTEKCAECHFEDDFYDETADAIAAMIGDVKGGAIKHPAKLEDLSDEDIKKLAEYFASQ
jgi:cytochrome c553